MSATAKVVSLFSGIGGIELGLSKSGFETELFCEIDATAERVLAAHFPGIPLHPDVTNLKSLPKCDVLTAGFPCQDLSQAGRKSGIDGAQSGLAGHIFRLLATRRSHRPDWIVIENVPYMLRLARGGAMSVLVGALEDLGYRWAYRVVDARSFGVPQRRQRVLLLASRKHRPEDILFSEDCPNHPIDPKPAVVKERQMYGFYWTEGSRGVGWALNAVPPIKGGSGLGIPSPPAIWQPWRDFVGTIALEDAERLQGFPSGWTSPALKVTSRDGARWRLVGNAVCVNVAEWLGETLLHPGMFSQKPHTTYSGHAWPNAAWGYRGKVFQANVTAWPRCTQTPKLKQFLEHPLRELSERATVGFLKRAEQCTNVTYSSRFLASLKRHVDRIRHEQ